jgi:sulfoxide reductase heme-binding subunit YedZ
MNRFLSSKWAKLVVFLLGLIPLGALLWWVYKLDLTANPLEFITRYTGDWTLRGLMVTLAVTPLRELLKRPAITRFRRMLGLFTFFYAFLHLLTWIVFVNDYDPTLMWEDVAKRLYITVGMAGFLAMVPLAITSTNGWVKRLKFQRWQKLHRLIYAAALAGVLHYLWLVKSDIREPLLYGAILALLVGFRVVMRLRGR